MKKRKITNNCNKVILGLLFLATLFMSLCYASINSISFDISGSIAAISQTGIFIGEVIEKGDVNDSIYNVYGTMLDSKVILSDTDPDSSVTYEIVVYNNHSIDLSYVDVTYGSDYYDNTNIVFSTDLEVGDTVSANGGELRFTITFEYADGVTPSSLVNVLNCYLNFRFLHRVDYIESSGTQYINTMVTPDNTTTYDMTFAFHTVYETQALLGTRMGMAEGASFNLFLHNKVGSDNWQLRWDQGFNVGDYSDLPLNEWKKVNIVKELNTITYTSNDISYSYNIPEETWSLDSYIYLFTQNQINTEEERRAKIKLYEFKLYKDGELVRDYIPVLDLNSVPCLYDLVSNEYFYNIGEDEFGYSYDDNIYDYIESSGTQYIDLEITADEYTQVEMVMSFNSNYTATQGIFGARTGYNYNSFNMFWVGSKLRWDYYNTMNYPTNNSDMTKATYIYANSSKIKINTDVSSYTNTSSFNTNQNVYVFAVNSGGDPLFISSGMKVYYIKVLYNGGVTKNLIPVTDANGVACFFDLVEQEFVYNKGEGTFTVSY